MGGFKNFFNKIGKFFKKALLFTLRNCEKAKN